MPTFTPFHSAGIILSYQCSSKCRHCLYSCSPSWKEWADPGTVDAICRGTRACVRHVTGFHLAGGEAFLRFPILLEAVRTATRHAIPLDYVETNADWFTGPDDAHAKLVALREAGLRCLLISASPQHAEHIELAKTFGVIQASLHVFGQHGTFVWLPEFLQELADIGHDGTLAWEEYVAAVGERRACRAASYGGQLVPGGRAPYGLRGYLPLRPLDACLGDTCEQELLHCGYGHYDLYGNIIPCSCAGISLGDARDLPAAVRRFCLKERPILRVLVREGVAGLLRLAEAEYGYRPAEGYAGKCHLCMDIRRHLVLNGGAFDELTPRAFYQNV